MEPNGVVGSCEVEEYNIYLFTGLKCVLDVVGGEGDQIHHQLPVAKTPCSIGSSDQLPGQCMRGGGFP